MPRVLPKERGVIDDAQLAETRVACAGGLRHCAPYAFTFNANAKMRWFGSERCAVGGRGARNSERIAMHSKRLIDTLKTDFVAMTEAQFADAIAAGRVLSCGAARRGPRCVRSLAMAVNGERVTADRLWRDGDKMTHLTHRHESPVVDTPIRVLATRGRVLAVDKPPSIPVHPGGRFRHLSLTFLLAREHNRRRLYLAHRLDRFTSGVMVFGETSDAATALGEMIRNRSLVRKCYVALVHGDARSVPQRIDAPIVVRGSHVGVCSTGADGKPARTYMRCIRYDAERNRSYMLCVPRTGRTHQIRVHLQHVGHPIANDPLYQLCDDLGDDDRVFKPVLSDGRTKRRHELVAESAAATAADVASSGAASTSKALRREGDATVPSAAAGANAPHSSSPFANERVDYCPECQHPDDEPEVDKLLIYLHALSYRFDCSSGEWNAALGIESDCDKLQFSTPLPPWWCAAKHADDADATLEGVLRHFDELCDEQEAILLAEDTEATADTGATADQNADD